MTYRCKQQPGPQTPFHKTRRSISGDLLQRYGRYRPSRTATYMTDRTALRLVYAIAAAKNLIIIFFEAAFLHEKFHSDKTVFAYQYLRFDGSLKHLHNAEQLTGNIYGHYQAFFDIFCRPYQIPHQQRPQAEQIGPLPIIPKRRFGKPHYSGRIC